MKNVRHDYGAGAADFKALNPRWLKYTLKIIH